MRRDLAILSVTRRPSRAVPAIVRAALALTLAASAGCSSRQHANPLDPANRQTEGRPAGFAAVALSNQVLLRWTATALQTQVFRKTDVDADYAAITPVLGAGTSSFIDSNTSNGVTYHYRLYFVTDKGPSGLPSTADATPSRVVAYAADGGLGSVLRLGADGREIATEQPGFGETTFLTIDRARDLLWVANFNDGVVSIYTPAVGTRVTISGMVSPDVVAIDPLDGSAWITDTFGNEVRHYLNSGDPGTPVSIPSLSGPIGIDFDAVNRVLWVCEKTAGRVRRYSTGTALLGQVFIGAPTRVAVDSANGDAWITSFDTARLIHISASGSILNTITSLRGPVGVAVDPRRGRIWVADPVASQVIAYRRDGTEELRVTGLPAARDLSIELSSGEAWVALGSTIARISPAGALLTTTRGLSAPAGVALDLVGP